jgi:hypothetical protein
VAKTKKLDIDTKTATEVNRLRQVERACALLKEEHTLLEKKPSGSVRNEGGSLRVH